MLRTDQAGLSSFVTDTFFTDVTAVSPRVALVDMSNSAKNRASVRLDPLQIFRRVYFGIWAFGTRIDQIEVVATLSFRRQGKAFRTEQWGWWSASNATFGELSRNLPKPTFNVTERTGTVPGNPMPITGGGVQDEITLIDNLNNQSSVVNEVRLAPYRTAESCDEITLDGVVAVGALCIPQFRVFLAVHSSRENV